MVTRMRFWSIEQSRHPSFTELSHAQICMQNIDHTLIWDGYDLTHFHFWVIQNIIMDFIDNFCWSDLIWTTWTWYGFCARTTTTKFSEPLLNYSIWRSRVRIIFFVRRTPKVRLVGVIFCAESWFSRTQNYTDSANYRYTANKKNRSFCFPFNFFVWLKTPTTEPSLDVWEQIIVAGGQV